MLSSLFQFQTQVEKGKQYFSDLPLHVFPGNILQDNVPIQIRSPILGDVLI